ncbi:MAG TPA: hypothetical protein VFB52_09535 [Solirubrobacterales bacterium]|nr:hypothetical protein [Solirubrobacterales bacterium]
MATDTAIELEQIYNPAEAEEAVGSRAFPNTRREGWLIALVFAVAYGVLGYFTVVNGHVVQFDGLERLADAYMAWWNDPPKLAAIGLSVAPVGTLVFLAPALIKPFATSLVALPMITAIAGGATLAMLNTLMARCGLGRLIRIGIVVLIGINPMFAFYAGNGSPEALGLFLAASALLALISWQVTDETRYLIGAGMAIGVAVMVDYTYLAWAFSIMLAIAFIGPGPRGGQTKLRSSLLLFLTPIFYSVLVWTILNAVILDSPFQWLEIGSVQVAPNLDPAINQIPASLDGALSDLAEAVFGIAPLAFLALPLLVVSAFGRRDSLGLGLIAVLLSAAGAIVIVALLEDRASYVTLSTVLPIMVASIASIAWLFRVENTWRFVLVLVAVVGMVLAIPLSWNAMRNYDYQDQEQAFTRFLETRDSQEGTASLGGYRVGIDPELGMADYINNKLKPENNSILTDSSVTYGVILMSGKPSLFVDRADYDEGEWQTIRDHPFGEVQYMLVANTGADLVRQRYPGLDLGAQPGLVPIFHTDRYVLVQLEPGVIPAASVATPDRLRNQPRLITPREPLAPPPVRPAGPGEAGLSPLPESGGGVSEEGSSPDGLSSEPQVEGE